MDKQEILNGPRLDQDPTFLRYVRGRMLDAESDRRKGIYRPPTNLAYNDVIFQPRTSVVTSPDQVDTSVLFSRHIPLAIPIVPANMSTITEGKMAIAMARLGGIGVIHRDLSIEAQVAEVCKVKDATKFVVEDYPTVRPTDPVSRVRELMETRGRGFAAVLDEKGEFVGVITSRDVLENRVDADRLVQDGVMTPREQLKVAPAETTLDEAKGLLYKYRKEKIPLIDGEGRLVGFVTERDIRMLENYPHATIDKKTGKLRVAAAVGVKLPDAMERVDELVKAGVDAIVIDVLHGDSPQVVAMGKAIKAKYPNVDTVLGNVATFDSTIHLIKETGADGVKAGYGVGSVCTTQLVTGTGSPQITAVAEAAAAGYPDVPIIADGGEKTSGDIVKVLASGAQTAMFGGLVAGTDETPGEITVDYETGERVKKYSGMATNEASHTLARNQGSKAKNHTPQGVPSMTLYKGPVEPIINSLMDGVRFGIANMGARNIKELQENALFVLQTPEGVRDGTPHHLNSSQRR